MFLLFNVQLSWVIYADIQCISHGGNLSDAIIAALYAALENSGWYLTYFTSTSLFKKLKKKIYCPLDFLEKWR